MTAFGVVKHCSLYASLHCLNEKYVFTIILLRHFNMVIFYHGSNHL